MMTTKTLRKPLLVLALMLAWGARPACAQDGQFFFLTDCRTGNFWSSAFLGIPTQMINGMIMGALDYDTDEVGGIPGLGSTYRINRIKNNGQKVDYYGKHYFGFHGADLFRDVEYSVKAGWQPAQIPVGFYARLGYRHENFDTRENETQEWNKHKINCLRPGIGVRISPLESLLDDDGWCPIIELGACYDYYVGYKGLYGHSTDQLNNGLTTRLSVGVKTESGAAVLLHYEKENYDLFNQDFTVNGIKPYENYTTKHYNLSVTVEIGF